MITENSWGLVGNTLPPITVEVKNGSPNRSYLVNIPRSYLVNITMFRFQKLLEKEYIAGHFSESQIFRQNLFQTICIITKVI